MYGILVIVCMNISISYAANLSSILSDMYTNTKNEETLSSMAGKVVVPDMFSRAYQVAQENDMVTFFETIDYTSNYINRQYSCDTEFSDIVNILRYTNTEFQEKTQQIIVQDPSQTNVRTPQRNEMVRSCMKISACKAGVLPQNFVDSVAARTQCQDLIQNSYSYVSANAGFLHTFDQDNFGEEYFQNGSLDDSEYDLLIDIQTIGDIMFESNKQTEELIFYRLPKVNRSSSNKQNN